MSVESVASQSLVTIFQATANATVALIVKDIPWLIPAMVVIFGLVQSMKVILNGIRRKKGHGIPKIILPLIVLAIGILYAWGSGIHHHRPCSAEMVVEGVGLGAANICCYHIGKVIVWLAKWWLARKDKK